MNNSWTGGTAQALRRCPNWRHRVFSPKISYWKTTRPLDLLLKHLRISCLNILPVVRPSSFDDGFDKTKCRSRRARRLTNERERERQQNLQFEKRGHLFFLSVNINSKEKKNKRRGGQTDEGRSLSVPVGGHFARFRNIIHPTAALTQKY